jgi:cell division protein ZipA
MLEGISDATLLRIGIGLAAALLFVAIVYAARKRPEQGRRKDERGDASAARREPTLREILEGMGGDPAAASAAPAPELGTDTPPRMQFEKLLTLTIAARAGQRFHGPDIVVAAEKAGLVYGDRQIFHRMVDNHPERGPVFSVANLMQPGSFDMASLQGLHTPGLGVFMALPGPTSALDAWDAMLPAAQRIAELLDGVLLDEERNALGRQRIAHIREELRAFDRRREGSAAGLRR